MADSKSSKCKVFLESIPPLAGANLLFFCLEFILAIEVQSVSLFSDSIVFLEGAAVSVLTASNLKVERPRARSIRTLHKDDDSRSDVLHVLDDYGELLYC